MEGTSSSTSKVGGQSDQLLLEGRRLSHVLCGLPDLPVLDCVEWDRLVGGHLTSSSSAPGGRVYLKLVAPVYPHPHHKSLSILLPLQPAG